MYPKPRNTTRGRLLIDFDLLLDHFLETLFDHGGAIGDRRHVRGRFLGERNLAKKNVWGTLGTLGNTLDHQGGGSLITKRKRIQKPRSRVQVQVQVEDPRPRTRPGHALR